MDENELSGETPTTTSGDVIPYVLVLPPHETHIYRSGAHAQIASATDGRGLPLEPDILRAQEVLGFKVLTSHLQQQGGLIMFEGTFGQPGEQLILLFRLHAANAQMIQHRLEVRTPRHAVCSIVLEHGRIDVELLRQIGDGTNWSRWERGR